MSALVRYLDHSGFAVEIGRAILIFDYYNDKGDPRSPEGGVITQEALSEYDRVIVFVSHSHPDHFNPAIYDWASGRVKVEYYVSFELPQGSPGHRLSPGESVEARGLSVHAFGSTDLGISFLVGYEGVRLFHAGDLNWWHWREESTPREIAEAEEDFRREMEPIEQAAKEHPFDIAFFPLDPRQKTFFDAGTNYFLHAVKPRILIPMHTMGASELVLDYARKNGMRGVRVIPLTERGETFAYEREE